MTKPQKAVLAVSLLTLMGASGAASAAQLTLGYETTAGGTAITSLTPSSPDAANFFGHSFNGQTLPVPGSGSPGDGFYDAFLFVVPNSDIDSITTSIDLSNVSQISQLQVRLFDFSLNPVPNEPNALVGPVYDATWNHIPIPVPEGSDH